MSAKEAGRSWSFFGVKIRIKRLLQSYYFLSFENTKQNPSNQSYQ